MSRTCEICAKRPMSGHNVSHSHKKTKRRWLPNLQKAKVNVDGKEVSMKLCAKCLKTQSKIRDTKETNTEETKKSA